VWCKRGFRKRKTDGHVQVSVSTYPTRRQSRDRVAVSIPVKCMATFRLHFLQIKSAHASRHCSGVDVYLAVQLTTDCSLTVRCQWRRVLWTWCAHTGTCRSFVIVVRITRFELKLNWPELVDPVTPRQRRVTSFETIGWLFVNSIFASGRECFISVTCEVRWPVRPVVRRTPATR